MIKDLSAAPVPTGSPRSLQKGRSDVSLYYEQPLWTEQGDRGEGVRYPEIPYPHIPHDLLSKSSKSKIRAVNSSAFFIIFPINNQRHGRLTLQRLTRCHTHLGQSISAQVHGSVDTASVFDRALHHSSNPKSSHPCTLRVRLI